MADPRTSFLMKTGTLPVADAFDDDDYVVVEGVDKGARLLRPSLLPGTAGSSVADTPLEGDQLLARDAVTGETIRSVIGAWRAKWHALAGGFARTLTDKLSEGVSVKDFSGGDAQTKLVNALASGEPSLLIPSGYQITVEQAATLPAGLHLRGRRGAKITASGANVNALVAGGDGILIEDLEIVACGSSGSYAAYNGAAIVGIGRSDVTVRRVKISNHRGWGILFVDGSGIEIERVRAVSANIPAGSPDHTQMFADIGLIGGSSDCSVTKCRLTSGQAFPILVQTVNGTAATVETVEIADNLIRNARGHGIALYSQNMQTSAGAQFQGTGQDTWRGCIVARNRVFNTQGSLVFASGPNKPYGTGIYIQGATGTLIQGNTVDGSCVETDTESLAPGGIGITNCRRFQCIGNHSINGTWYGAYYANPNDIGTAGDVGTSQGNIAAGCAKAGFKLSSARDIVATGDTAARNTTYGWEIRDANAAANYMLKGCFARKNTLDGFRTLGAAVNKLRLDLCEAEGNLQHGIAFDNSSVNRLYLRGNRSFVNTGRGFSIGTGINVDEYEGNFALSNGANLDYIIQSKIPTGQETVGDASITLTIQNSDVQRLTAALNTADRTVTCEAANLRPGRRRLFVRTAAATGSFAWNIQGSLVILTAAKQWAEIQSDGTSWQLIGYGTLP